MKSADREQRHIVHIIPTLNIGGAERFVVSLCTHTDTAKFRNTVITLWDNAPLAETLPEEVAHISFNIGTVGKLQRTKRLSALLQELQADIVHTHLFSADLWGRLAAKRLGLPVVTTEHNVNHAEPLHWRFIKRIMRRYTNRYTAPSLAVRSYMRHAYGIRQKHIKIIPHGIDTARFADIAPATFEKPYQLLVIGRLVEQKGHRVLIDALSQLEDVPVELTVVGEGVLERGLKAYATEQRVADRITWAGAVLDVVPVYAAADVVIIPSLWEGFGLVALEALASERAVIASDIDGLAENITHGETGMLVPAGDADALAEAIQTAVLDTSKLQTLAATGRTAVQESGDIRHMGAAYTKLYQQMLAS